MPVPVATIDETGIHVPSIDQIEAYLKDAYRAIYGQDVYLENDSQDGQFIGILAAAINDTNAMAVSVYNSRGPATAQGIGLSSVVKINGIKRASAAYSTVDLKLVGQDGTTITNGVVTDTAGNRWKLPASVTIPPAGEITATATASEMGAIMAASNTVTQIATPTRGWQSVTNPASAVPGAPVESDAALRQRQAVSTALPSRTVLEGMVGAVASVPGVIRYRAYENDGDIPDPNGIPSHSVALVVEGGDAAAIAAVMAAKKTPGVQTFGTTAQVVTDIYEISRTIRFFRPTMATIKVALQVRALAGYTTAVEAALKQGLVDWIKARAIGEGVEYFEVASPANFYDGPNAKTFKIVSLTIAKDAGAPGAADIAIAFNEAATATVADITVTVVP